MTVTTPYYGLNRRIYVPQVKESTYDEGDTTFLFVFDTRRNEGNTIRPSKISMFDDGMATGDEFAVQEIHMGTDLPARSIPLYLTPEALGLFGAFALGDDTATTPGGTLHTLAMAALSAGYPGSFGLEEHVDGPSVVSDTDFNHKGVVVDEWTASGGRTGLCNFDVTVSGSGSTGTPQTQDESTMTRPGRDSCYFPADAVRVGIKSVGSEHDPADESYTVPTSSFTHTHVTSGNSYTVISDLIESWSITYRNVWELRRGAGTSSTSGLVGICPVWSRREITASLTYRSAAAFDSFVKAFLSGTTGNNIEYKLAIEGVSDLDVATTDYASFLIQIPVATLADVPDGSFGAINQETINWVAKKSKGTDDYDPIRIFVHDGTTGAYNQ